MWSNNAKSISIQLALLLGQLLILLCSLYYIFYVYVSDIRPDKIANDTFQETNCFIIDKKLNSKRDAYYKYRADFLINYNVSGVQYNRWVSANGLDESFQHSKNNQQKILNQYTTGETYPCFYNPENPETALLIRRYNWASTFPLFIPSVVIVIMLFYILDTITNLLKVFKNRKMNGWQ